MPSVEHQGARIHYEEQGSGPPLLLAHSFLFSGEMWGNQLTALAKRYRVINVDLRGHGQSGPYAEHFTLYDVLNDHLAVLDHLGIERAAFLGLSIGGMMALRAALNVPDRVAALALLDTSAEKERATVALKYHGMSNFARAFGARPLASSIANIMFSANARRQKPEMVDHWKQYWAGVDVPSIRAGLRALLERDSVLERTAEIQIPTLIMVGERDAGLPPELSRRLHHGIAGSRFVVVPEAGHIPPLEQPDMVTTELLDFLDGLKERW